MALALHRAIVYGTDGGATLTSAGLQRLLDVAGKEGAGGLEDWVPVDLGLNVSIPIANRVLRIDPGTESAPISDIARAKLVCAAIDSYLLERHGFTGSDIVELSARAQDSALKVVAPTWSDSRIDSPGRPICINDDELEAGDHLGTNLRDIARECDEPERALAAAEWTSVPVGELTIDLGASTAWFGPILGFRDGSVISPLPSGFLLEGMMASLARLGAEAKEGDSGVNRLFHVACAEQVAELLGRHHRVFPVPRTPLGPIHSVCRVTSVDYLAVEVIADLETVTRANLDEAATRLATVVPGSAYGNSVADVTLPADSEIVRLVVVATPTHSATFSQPAEVILTIDDLRRIVATSTDDRDLYWFCRDLMDLASRTRLLGFEIVNYWGWWLSNGKSFHHGADLPNLILFDPHVVGEEWADAARLTELETALSALNLPDTTHWEYRDIDPMRTVIRQVSLPEVWTVAWQPTTYAVRTIDSATPRQFASHIGNLGESATWMIARAGQAFLDLAPPALRIHLEYSADGPPIGGSRLVDPSTLSVGWTQALWTLPSAEIHARVADAIADAFGLLPAVDSRLVDRARVALRATPLAFSLDRQDVRPVTVNLPRPQSPHPTQRALLQRNLAEALRDGSILPGRYEGDDAIRLESDVTFPYLYDALVADIRRWDRRSLILLAARELEASVSRRRRDRYQLHANVSAMEVEYNPVERALEIAREGSRDAAARRFILETAMRLGADGAGIPNEREWCSMIARSELCIESGMRSEGLRYEVAPGTLIVEPSFEFRLEPSDSPISSLGEFRVAEAAADMPNRDEHEGQSRGDGLDMEGTPEGDADAGRDFLDVFPDLAGLDAAVHRSLGFRIPTLLGVAAALASWPATNDDPAPEVPLRDLEAFCVEAEVPDPGNTAAVLEFLTLRAEDLQAEDPEPWELARRKARLVTRPLPEVTPGMRVVMPWSLDEAAAIYFRYLQEGRWPFPAADWPPEIRRAADDYREVRNRELEDAVDEALRAAGFVTRVRIKPERAHRFGYTSLSGEIDVLAASSADRTLWIVEAKDPSEAFSIAEIERSVRRFTEPDGYVDRLSRKVADTTRDAEAVLAKLGLPRAEWVVRGIMVTRRTSPAAYAPGVSLPFATLETVVGEMAKLHVAELTQPDG